MREGKKHPFAINVWRWGLLILLLVLWEIGARLKWIDPFFQPFGNRPNRRH